MKPHLGRIAGVLIFLAAIAAGVVWQFRPHPVTANQPGSMTSAAPGSVGVPGVPVGPEVALMGKVGGEKIGFLEDPVLKSLLARSGLSITAKKAGSVEMVRDPVTGQNFLWPASQVDLENFKSAGGSAMQAEEIFQSPLVFYSWDIVTDALVTNGIVERLGETFYVVDLAKLVALVDRKAKWTELGLTRFYSSVLIQSTDPARSNSGNMWAALLANTYNGGDVLTSDKADAIIPKIKTFFDRVGFMEASSGTLFDKFLKQGAGAYPIIVAYENQLLEFTADHPELIDPVRQKLRILYPRPTVWASHPLIALDNNSKRLIAALKDPAVQRLAWEKHGFRSGLMGAVSTNGLSLGGIPATIDGVMQIPSLAVMSRLTDALTPQK